MAADDPPDWICCSICTNVLKEAVATVEGHCYCLECISDWFNRHEQRVQDRLRSGKLKKAADMPLRGPKTNLPLSTRVLYEVIPLRTAATELQDRATREHELQHKLAERDAQVGGNTVSHGRGRGGDTPEILFKIPKYPIVDPSIASNC